MQTVIDPLILVLDFDQLRLRSKKELLVLLRDHILLVIMGQLRDIEERERLSRGLCREYNLFFEANDIQVFPRPLSTKQTDARLIAPRKLAHLIGLATIDIISGGPTEAPSNDAGAERSASPGLLTRLGRLLKFALLLVAALLPLLGACQLQLRTTAALGPMAGSGFASGRSTIAHPAPPIPRREGRARAEEIDASLVGLRVAEVGARIKRADRSRARDLRWLASAPRALRTRVGASAPRRNFGLSGRIFGSKVLGSKVLGSKPGQSQVRHSESLSRSILWSRPSRLSPT